MVPTREPAAETKTMGQGTQMAPPARALLPAPNRSRALRPVPAACPQHVQDQRMRNAGPQSWRTDAPGPKKQPRHVWHSLHSQKRYRRPRCSQQPHPALRSPRARPVHLARLSLACPPLRSHPRSTPPVSWLPHCLLRWPLPPGLRGSAER
eukprot:scaffold40262_cov30-Tisochrysis_lutea.AAC.4